MTIILQGLDAYVHCIELLMDGWLWCWKPQIAAFVLEAFFAEMEMAASTKSSDEDGSSSDSDNEVRKFHTFFNPPTWFVRAEVSITQTTTKNNN